MTDDEIIFQPGHMLEIQAPTAQAQAERQANMRQQYFQASSCSATMDACVGGSVSYMYNPSMHNLTTPSYYPLMGNQYGISEKIRHREKRKAFKSECNAQQMLRELIGFEQWKIYRKTNRVIVKVNKKWWVIGNIFGNYDKFKPLLAKPDVVRIDNNKKKYGTSFCVVSEHKDSIPYTDKVLTFATFLSSNPKSFEKIGNRMDEHKFNNIPECAVFD